MAAVLVTALIVGATIAGVTGSRREGDASSDRRAWARAVGYWLTTILVSYELAAGALWDLLRIEYVRVVLAHLGYPEYLLLILGVWRIPGALALATPRFPRLKEWAYAGAFFDYSGAAASHWLAGDGPRAWVFPVLFAGVALVSWTLRPSSRRLPLETKADLPRMAWVTPVLMVGAMLVVAWFTLPSGKPPL